MANSARSAPTTGAPSRTRTPQKARERGTRAIAYLRVSTMGQEQHGKNLEGQLEEVLDFCRRKGYRLDPERDVYSDVVSGARTDRKGYYKLLARIEKEDASVVVAWNVSRLGRNTLDGAWLLVKVKEHGLRIETAQEGMDFTADPASELVFEILTAAAKFQRNTIMQDMLRGKKTGVKRGKWVNGRSPFGYRAVGPRGAKVLEPDDHAPIVRELFTRYAAGESAYKLADWMNTLGLRATDGEKHARSWAPNSVGRILDSPVYRGMVHFQGEVTNGEHPALIDPETWDTVRRLRDSARRRNPGRPTTSTDSENDE